MEDSINILNAAVSDINTTIELQNSTVDSVRKDHVELMEKLDDVDEKLENLDFSSEGGVSYDDTELRGLVTTNTTNITTLSEQIEALGSVDLEALNTTLSEQASLISSNTSSIEANKSLAETNKADIEVQSHILEDIEALLHNEDESLNTTSTTVVGSINELKSSIENLDFSDGEIVIPQYDDSELKGLIQANSTSIEGLTDDVENITGSLYDEGESLNTTSKTIVGGINELKSSIDNLDFSDSDGTVQQYDDTEVKSLITDNKQSILDISTEVVEVKAQLETHDTSISSNTTKINTINNKIANKNEELATVAKTLYGSINELKEEIDNIEIPESDGSVEIIQTSLRIGQLSQHRHIMFMSDRELPAHGTLIENASEALPEAFLALQTEEYADLVITDEEWQTMSTAWSAVGGVPFFSIDVVGNTIRLPDTRGMYAEPEGFDSLVAGNVHLDQIENITGSIGWQYSVGTIGIYGGNAALVGAFKLGTSRSNYFNGTYSGTGYGIGFDASRIVRTGKYTRPRAYGIVETICVGTINMEYIGDQETEVIPDTYTSGYMSFEYLSLGTPFVGECNEDNDGNTLNSYPTGYVLGYYISPTFIDGGGGSCGFSNNGLCYDGTSDVDCHPSMKEGYESHTTSPVVKYLNSDNVIAQWLLYDDLGEEATRAITFSNVCEFTSFVATVGAYTLHYKAGDESGKYFILDNSKENDIIPTDSLTLAYFTIKETINEEVEENE